MVHIPALVPYIYGCTLVLLVSPDEHPTSCAQSARSGQNAARVPSNYPALFKLLDLLAFLFSSESFRVDFVGLVVGCRLVEPSVLSEDRVDNLSTSVSDEFLQLGRLGDLIR